MSTFLIAILISLFPACPTEDSTLCYWDGARGNGIGNSYIALSEDMAITFNR
jgi:hypothetical protein